MSIVNIWLHITIVYRETKNLTLNITPEKNNTIFLSLFYFLNIYSQKMSSERKIVPIACEPENLMKLAEAYGADCTHISFSQIYSFDIEDLEFIPKPVISVIFLFPIGNSDGYIEKRHKEDKDPLLDIKDKTKIPFFAHQLTGNLCGTMAMLHNIINNQNVIPIVKGSWIDHFIKETENKTPHERGVFIDNSSDLLDMHNNNANESSVPIPDGKVDTHFACFTQFCGIMWELDGRKPYPINHGECGSDILSHIFSIINNDFFKYMTPEDQIRSSIIAMSRI